MGLATPTAVAAGIGRAAKNGVLIKGGSTLEEYSKIRNVVLDKTGTLTTGKFRISGIESLNGLPENEIRSIVLALEQRSSHPIAKALVEELKEKSDAFELQEVEEVKGEGIQGKSAQGDIYKLGSARFIDTEESGHKSTLFLKKNDTLVSRIEIEDGIKPGAREMVQALKSRGIRTILLSGDKKERCDELAEELGIDVVHAEQLPNEKLERIEAYAKDAPTAMVGDGVNDAPALARSNVGVSLGDATEVAIQSARVVLLDGSDLRKVTYSMSLSRNTVTTIKQNLFWAFFYNVIAIPIAAVGLLNPMIAALSMAFSDVIVVGNSIRLKFKWIE
jgi:Cu+-exporting ATPase